MKRFLAIMVVCGCVLGLVRAATPQPQLANGIMAIVDNDIITYQDVFDYIKDTLSTLRSQYPGLTPDQSPALRQKTQQVWQEGLEQLIERKLILHEFKRKGYTLPENVIRNQQERVIRDQYGGHRLDLIRTLRAKGMTLDDWKKKVRDDFIITAMRSEKISKSKILVSPHQIEEYYANHLTNFSVGTKYKVRTIMISPTGKPSQADARKMAQEIVAELNQGASFAQMARIYSDGVTRAKGGDRGWVNLQTAGYQASLAHAIRTLKPGQHSGVITVGNTYWIVQVDGVQRAHLQTLPQVRDQIEQTLKQREGTRIMKQWIQQLKAKSFIRYF